MQKARRFSVLLAMAVIFIAFDRRLAAEELKPIEVPGDRAFTESITAGPDGTLYLSSLASGGIGRVKPGASTAEAWIAPGAFGSRSTFGVAGPGSAAESHLLGFDLATGDGKINAPFPGKTNLCNDLTVASDGTVYVTNSLSPQILQLKPGRTALEVWVEDQQFQPPSGAGLDGIAIGGDGNIYVNTFNGGKFFRVEVKGGMPGAVTKLETSRPLKLPDGLRQLSGDSFLMAEGSGSLDRVTVDGNKVIVETLKGGLKEPTSVAKVGGRAWVAEGQLSHLFGAKDNGPPQLPFEIVPVAIRN
jgi:streptogramin lyase